MDWFKHPFNLTRNHRVQAAEYEVAGSGYLFFQAVEYCTMVADVEERRPDGAEFIPEAQVSAFGGRRLQARVTSLVKHQIWAPLDRGYLVDVRLWNAKDNLPEPPRPGRPYIPLSLRLAVYARDGWRCLRCGAAENLSLDHRIPYSLGGPDTMENLQTLCMPCNDWKGVRVYVAT